MLPASGREHQTVDKPENGTKTGRKIARKKPRRGVFRVQSEVFRTISTVFPVRKTCFSVSTKLCRHAETRPMAWSFVWQGQKDLNRPSCGARKSPRGTAPPCAFRPLRRPRLASSAPGGARRGRPALSECLGFTESLYAKEDAVHADGVFLGRGRRT